MENNPFDFDSIIERRNTGSVKWDLVDGIFGGDGLLPFWVADMDFPSPQPVVDALSARARHGVFGYTAAMPSYYGAVQGWFMKRHGWAVDTASIVFHPGVVPALNLIVRTFTEPGDAVVIQRPVYYPFTSAVRQNGRVLVNNPLVLESGRYRMDLDDLRAKIRQSRARMLILCNPHNPVGRAWTCEELHGLHETCAAEGVLVVADEIWCDITLGANRYVPFASLSDEARRGSVICTAPSKTFNLAGLHTANVIIADEALRGRFTAAQREQGLHGPTAFGAAACEAAYSRGGPWLDALLAYLEDNYRYLENFLAERLPRLVPITPEATYLSWIDFRDLGLDREGLIGLLVKKAGLALDHGHIFGAEGEGFARLNFACPRDMLEEGLTKLDKAING